LSNFLKEREAKRKALMLDFAQRGTPSLSLLICIVFFVGILVS